jgi:hypothetical protein
MKLGTLPLMAAFGCMTAACIGLSISLWATADKLFAGAGQQAQATRAAQSMKFAISKNLLVYIELSLHELMLGYSLEFVYRDWIHDVCGLRNDGFACIDP